MHMRIPLDLRGALRLPVSCSAVITRGCRESRVLLVNLSVWGCAVRGPFAGERGDRCGLFLIVPDAEGPLPIDLARVRWKAGADFGVEFLTMPVRSRSRLRRFLLELRTTSWR